MQRGRGSSSETDFREKCRQHDLRVTPQRLAIFDLVRRSGAHPNAEVIFRRVRKEHPNVSFDTVNRTLLSFARIGILKVVEGYGYPKRYDPRLESHHHFHCVRCNRIIDFEEGCFDAVKVPEAISRRYTITDRKVVLEGICDRCRGDLAPARSGRVLRRRGPMPRGQSLATRTIQSEP